MSAPSANIPADLAARLEAEQEKFGGRHSGEEEAAVAARREAYLAKIQAKGAEEVAHAKKVAAGADKDLVDEEAKERLNASLEEVAGRREHILEIKAGRAKDEVDHAKAVAAAHHGEA